MTLPWRKYRIEIHSESIRTIPIHSDICIRANSNHSEPIRNQVFNPDQSKSIRHWIYPNRIINQNQSKSFRPCIYSDWLRLIWTENLVSDWCLGINRIMSDRFLTIFHQTRYKKFFGLVRNDSNWFGMIRIGSDTDIGMNRNNSDWLGINFNPILSPGSRSPLDFLYTIF